MCTVVTVYSAKKVLGFIQLLPSLCNDFNKYILYVYLQNRTVKQSGTKICLQKRIKKKIFCVTVPKAFLKTIVSQLNLQVPSDLQLHVFISGFMFLFYNSTWNILNNICKRKEVLCLPCFN